MDKYSDILSSFGTKDTLNPTIWNNVDSDTPNLKPEIRKALLMIAGEFLEFLGENIFVDDVRFTGSLANFNWSKFSDIDLHLYVDFEQFEPEDREVYKELFNLKKTLFNTTHDIRIKGYDVELYAEDTSESHFSTGVFSVLFDEWVHKPEKENVKIDKDMLMSKAKSMMDKIDNLIEETKNDDYEKAVKQIDTFKDKLKKYRSSGLEKDGEFSYENLVFKFLRRNGYIEKLFDFKNKLMDKNLSLENQDVE
jgi:predicted nucleotidyltransferase